MPDISLNYIDKSISEEASRKKTINPTQTNGLIPTDLRVSVRGQSIVVNKKNVIQQHIDLDNVCTWSLEGSKLIIRQVDNGTPIILTFLDPALAKQGEERFTSLKNGGY